MPAPKNALVRTCSVCRIEKPRTDFKTNHTGPRAGHMRSSMCKICLKAHYNLRYRPKYIERNKALILEALRNGCLDCPERDIVVLQFDHRDHKIKARNIADWICGKTTSTTKLREEIAKCDVVCSNCHIRRTAATFGNWRTLL